MFCSVPLFSDTVITLSLNTLFLSSQNSSFSNIYLSSTFIHRYVFSHIYVLGCVCIIRMKPILDIRELVISCFLSVCAYTRAHARTHAFFSLAVFNLPSLISFSYKFSRFLYVHIYFMRIRVDLYLHVYTNICI